MNCVGNSVWPQAGEYLWQKYCCIVISQIIIRHYNIENYCTHYHKIHDAINLKVYSGEIFALGLSTQLIILC